MAEKFIESKFTLSFRFISFIGVFSESEVIKRLKNIKKQQIDVKFTDTEQAAVFADNIQLNNETDNQKNYA